MLSADALIDCVSSTSEFRIFCEFRCAALPDRAPAKRKLSQIGVKLNQLEEGGDEEGIGLTFFRGAS